MKTALFVSFALPAAVFVGAMVLIPQRPAASDTWIPVITDGYTMLAGDPMPLEGCRKEISEVLTDARKTSQRVLAACVSTRSGQAAKYV